MLNIRSNTHMRICHLLPILPYVITRSVQCWITPSIFTCCKSSRRPLIGAICNLKVVYLCVVPCVWSVLCWDSIVVRDICSTRGQHSRIIICTVQHLNNCTHTNTGMSCCVFIMMRSIAFLRLKIMSALEKKTLIIPYIHPSSVSYLCSRSQGGPRTLPRSDQERGRNTFWTGHQSITGCSHTRHSLKHSYPRGNFDFRISLMCKSLDCGGNWTQ